MTKQQPTPLAPHPLLTDYYDASDEARRETINALFDAAAPDYDWINAVMSFGTGARYRGETLDRLGVSAGTDLLDVGSGTGVIAALAQERCGETGRVVALDPSAGMLARAAQRGVRCIVNGRGETLPFPDASFDYLTMGYALRHVSDLTITFREYFRVLKPGGRVLLLEITRPQPGLRYGFLRMYLNYCVPMVTRIMRRNTESQRLMEYFWSTIDQCVPPQSILDALSGAGFHDVDRRVELGTFSEYTGTKPGGESA